MSPTGRKIHEAIFQREKLPIPVHIGILETPTGFEVNAIHGWPERMEEFFKKGLQNYKPEITRIRAWRRDGEYSTNDSAIVDAILTQDYLYCGAGSPGYAIKHLENSRAYENLIAAHKNGSILCLGSATAVALGRFALPVYEIFKAGEDLHWRMGLDFFAQYDLPLAIVPHWNNQEGEDFDTTRCWMGVERFMRLRAMLPDRTPILGIDEQTAVIVDVTKKGMTVVGIGNAYVLMGKKEKLFPSGSSFSFKEVTTL